MKQSPVRRTGNRRKNKVATRRVGRGSDWQRTIEALRRSEARYRSVVNAMTEGVIVQDATGHIVAANKSAESILGLTAKELAGRTIHDARWVTVREDGTPFPADQYPINVTLRTHVPQSNVVMGVARPDGELRWISINTQPIYRARSRKIEAAVASFTDITDQKHAESMLVLLRRAVDAATSGITILDAMQAGTPVIYCNPAFERMSGYEAADLIGRERGFMRGGRTDPAMIAAVERAMTEGGSCRVITEAHRKDGTPFWHELTISPIRDAHGKLTHFLRVSDDVTERYESDQERARLAAVVNASADAITSSSADGTIMSWNPGAERLYGYRAEEVLGKSISTLVPPEQRAAFLARRERVMRGEELGRYESERLSKSGKRIVLSVSQAPMYDRTGKSIGVAGVATDVTALKHAYERLHESEQRFRLALNAVPDAFAIYDRNLRLQFVNRRALEVSGLPFDRLVGRRDDEIFEPDVTSHYLPTLLKTRDTRESQTVECMLKLREQNYTFVITYVPVLDDAGEIQQILSVSHDITARKQAEIGLSFMAQYDALTGLPNRSHYRNRLAQAMERARRNDSLLGVMFLDLDHFKEVNDTHGHAEGDRLLQQVAERLRVALRSTDTIARLGGDEFTVLVQDVTVVDQIAAVGEKILGAFAAPFDVAGGEAFVTPSIGITIYPFDEDDGDALLRNADVAMYQAKQERNAYRFYRSEMRAATAARASRSNQLRRALERDELELHYQPQFSLKDGSVIGVEALLRWNNAEVGAVPPSEFVPLAEDTGLIAPIGAWVLATASRQVRDWQCAGLPAFPVAVNISAAQFRRNDLLRQVRDVLGETGLDPRWLALEITESGVMDRADVTIRTLEALNEMGVTIAIDDFGTGYSSLSYLKQFPVDKIKIDQSFVRDVTVDPNDAAIVAAIVAMSRQLQLKTVAEGVETAEQLAFLTSLDCDECQGYYFSRPLSAHALAQYLRDRATLR